VLARAATCGQHEYYSGVSDWGRTYTVRPTVVPTWYVAFHRQVGPALWSGKRQFSHFETARTCKSWVMSATSSVSPAMWNAWKCATTASLPVC
jgi:hypothetical protein